VITINWSTREIFVPTADLTLVQSVPSFIYELDLNTFRLVLKDLEDNVEGMPYPTTHNHNTEVSVAGVTLARVIEMINGYTVTFEDGQYAVNLINANSNVGDVVNVNQVSVRVANSAGLITVGGASPWTEVIENGVTAAGILRLLAAVAAGKTSIVNLGNGFATVTFRSLADDKDRIVADMTGSERSVVTRDVT